LSQYIIFDNEEKKVYCGSRHPVNTQKFKELSQDNTYGLLNFNCRFFLESTTIFYTRRSALRAVKQLRKLMGDVDFRIIEIETTTVKYLKMQEPDERLVLDIDKYIEVDYVISK